MIVMEMKRGAILGSVGPIAHKGTKKHGWYHIAQVMIL